MTVYTSRTSCTPLFRTSGILTMPTQYTVLHDFLVNSLEYFCFNIEIHGVNTTRRLQLHKLLANLTSYRRVAYYANKKLFNVSRQGRKINNGTRRENGGLHSYFSISCLGRWAPHHWLSWGRVNIQNNIPKCIQVFKYIIYQMYQNLYTVSNRT